MCKRFSNRLIIACRLGEGVRSASAALDTPHHNGREPMSLDTPTLYLVATMVAALLGAMLLFFGRQENIPALKWWGMAYLLGAASIALCTLARDSLGDLLLLALNATGFVACGMVWNASRVFHGRKPNLPGLVLGALGLIAA